MLTIFALGVLGLILQSALLNLLPARWVPDLGLLIPVVAILIYAGSGATDPKVAHEIGIGAILGAPFMLATLAMAVTGLAAIIYRKRRRQGANLVVTGTVLQRDMAFFLVLYCLAVSASVVPVRWGRIAICGLLILGYALYLLRHTKCEGSLLNNPYLASLGVTQEDAARALHRAPGLQVPASRAMPAPRSARAARCSNGTAPKAAAFPGARLATPTRSGSRRRCSSRPGPRR